MATLTATAAASQPLTLDSLPVVDLTTLTQSELHYLSLCSPTAFDLHCSENLVIPSIDRSSFNESAGSRRQTFSRPSPNNHHSSHHHPLRHRLPGLLPSPKPPPPLHDPEVLENRSIISSLKVSLKSHPEFHHLDFPSPPPSPRDAVVSYGMRDTLVSFEIQDAMISLGKRKRGRKPRMQSVNSGEESEMGLEIVNRSGVAVDLDVLAGLEDPYGEELKRRTEGMVGNEEALLEFMRDLGGQWCSRRRKRRIVDASVLGDALPVGWKLILGLKRREGRASVYCRRYMSPGGRQFLSCKEVSAYLQSYFGGLHDAPLTMDKGGDIALQGHQLASENGGTVQKENDQRWSAEHEKEVSLLGMDNLAEVQIHDLFECHKCNMTFDEKDAYLQHLLSFHQRTTRRYRLGSSVGDGVILRDGKFECQFCHKVFHERRRYNGHVGIHVRNYVRGIEDSPGLLNLPRRTEVATKQDLPVRTSKMDALIEIAQNSILETTTTTTTVPRYDLNDGSSPHKLNAVSNPEIHASTSDHEMNSDSPMSESGTEDDMTIRTLNEDICHQNSEPVIANEKTEKTDESINFMNMDSLVDATISTSMDELNGSISETFARKDSLTFHADQLDKSCSELQRDSESNLLVLSTGQGVCDVENSVKLAHADTREHPKPEEVDNNKNAELVVSSGNSSGPAKEIALETTHQTSDKNALKRSVSESSMSPLQPPNGTLTSSALAVKGEDGLCSIDDRKHEDVSGLDEPRMDETEQNKFSFGGLQETTLQEVKVELANNPDGKGADGSSVQFESEISLNMAGKDQLRTVCVWCATEFNQDAVGSEIQSDSVGYMCPTCKAKFLGKLGH